MRCAMRRSWILVLGVVLSGCGGTRPTKYYVLDVPPAPTTQPAAQFPVSVLVARPITSNLYRDNRIVYGSGPVQLGTYEFERWAQSPVGMIQDALINSLRAAGQYRSVVRPGSNTKGDYILRTNLRELYEVDKPALVGRFSIQVELYDTRTGATLWGTNYSHDEPVADKTVASVVEALDKNVRAGIQQVTTELGQYFTSNPPKTTGGQ
jgi:ABC-type uncharacterized transport system auxiliary subunit